MNSDHRAAGGLTSTPGDLPSLSPQAPPASPPESSGAQEPDTARAGNRSAPVDQPAPAAGPYITPDEVAILETRLQDAGIAPAALWRAAKVPRIAMIEARDLARAHEWIDAMIARQSKGRTV